MNGLHLSVLRETVWITQTIIGLYIEKSCIHSNWKLKALSQVNWPLQNFWQGKTSNAVDDWHIAPPSQTTGEAEQENLGKICDEKPQLFVQEDMSYITLPDTPHPVCIYHYMFLSPLWLLALWQLLQRGFAIACLFQWNCTKWIWLTTVSEPDWWKCMK